MYRLLAVLGVLVVGWSLLAATGDSAPKPAVPPADASDVVNYGRQLIFTINTVSQQYVRPVERSELARMALSGLYEAVRQPVPPGLAGELERASGEQELLSVIYRARGNLGQQEALKGNQALLLSLQAMARSLDPYSMVLSGEDLRKSKGQDIASGVGLDLETLSGEGPLKIKTVIPGGPAQRAGLRPGDLITQIDHQPPGGIKAVLLVRGADEQVPLRRFLLTVQRGVNGAPREVTLATEPFQPETALGVVREPDNTWNYLLDRDKKIAYLRISTLAGGTAHEVQGVIADLMDQEVRGLILDLRWCPGGWLTQAIAVAKTFLKDGLVARIESRRPTNENEYSADGDGIDDLPIVVLINGDTSGGAELIAAALQDNHRALIAGQRSFGKGSIQTMIALPIPDAELKFTSGSFIRPSGKPLHRFPDSKPSDDWGVRPDPGNELPISPDLGRQIRDWYLLQALRPGSSSESLTIDDPEADPQRQAALRTLRAKLSAPKSAQAPRR